MNIRQSLDLPESYSLRTMYLVVTVWPTIIFRMCMTRPYLPETILQTFLGVQLMFLIHTDRALALELYSLKIISYYKGINIDCPPYVYSKVSEFLCSKPS